MGVVVGIRKFVIIVVVVLLNMYAAMETRFKLYWRQY